MPDMKSILGGISSLAGLIPGVGTAISAGSGILSQLLGGGGSSKGGGGSNLLELAMPALAEGGMGLLGALLSGKGKEQEMEKEFEMYKKKGGEQEQRMLKYLKPELPRYNIEKDLGTIDPAFKKMVLGSLTDVLGSERLGRYGVDPAALLSGIGSAPAAAAGGGAGGTAGDNAAERILGKYGGHRGKRTEEATRV